MKVTLNSTEIAKLFKQDPAAKADGGYQKLLVSLQEKLNKETGELELSDKDYERISRYAFSYGQGGWEDRLSAIFSRSLGANLGKTSEEVAQMKAPKERAT